jgi:hypothetical protein
MKIRFALAPALVLALVVACASSPPKTAFDVLGVTVTTVDASMKIYADLVVAGKVPQATQDKVRKAFETYQIAMGDAKVAVDAWFAIGAPAAAFPADSVGRALSAAGKIQAEAK